MHGIVAYTILNVCEKKSTSFCQVLCRCTQSKIGSFFLPHGVYLLGHYITTRILYRGCGNEVCQKQVMCDLNMTMISCEKQQRNFTKLVNLSPALFCFRSALDGDRRWESVLLDQANEHLLTGHSSMTLQTEWRNMVYQYML